jgi:4-amino-4-deoxy-L-arabinose transferase-like glycosyltransferase
MRIKFFVKSKLFKNCQFSIIIILIIALASLVRFPLLSAFPPLLLQDEAASAFNAISIAETGKDEWGQQFPLIFKSFGDNKPPVFIYTTALLYKIVGWTPILPRLTSAIAGTLLVLVIALWLKQIFKSERIALLGAFITALSPWTIYLSRMALESNLGLLFFTSGLLFLEYAKKRHGYVHIAISSLFFVLSAYTYHSYRFISGAFLLLLLLTKIFPQIITKTKLHLHRQPIFLIFIISSALILPGILNKGSLTRLQQTSITQGDRFSSILEYFRGTCHIASAELSILPLRYTCSVYWNQYTTKVLIFTQSIAEHLSPDFLFFKGDATLNRNPTASGEFFIFLYPLILLGMYQAFVHFKKYYIFLLSFFMTLIPSIMTGSPHSIRLSSQIPFAIFLIVLGITQLRKSYKHVNAIIIGLTIIFSAYHMVEFSLITYSESQQFLSQSQEISKKAYEYYQNGYVVYIDPQVISEPHIFFIFWNNNDPIT